MNSSKKIHNQKIKINLQMLRISGCSCSYYKTDSISRLSNRILNCELPTMACVLEGGEELQACSYFASRESLSLCQIVLLPYQVF